MVLLCGCLLYLTDGALFFRKRHIRILNCAYSFQYLTAKPTGTNTKQAAFDYSPAIRLKHSQENIVDSFKFLVASKVTWSR